MWSRRLPVAPGCAGTPCQGGYITSCLGGDPLPAPGGTWPVPPRRECQLRPRYAEGSRALREGEQPGEAARVDREGWGAAQQGRCREALAEG